MGTGYSGWTNPKCFVFRIELVKNKFAVLSFNNRVEETFMSGNGADTAIMYRGVEDISSLTKFFIANATFPVGTRFLVWGCKA